MKALALVACSLLLAGVSTGAAALNLNLGWLGGDINVTVDNKPMRQGSGTVATVERKLDGFDRISQRSAENVEVTIGPKFEVKLIGDDNLLELIDTRVAGSELIVEARSSYRTKTPIRVLVQLPKLERYSLEGSADARIAGLAGGDVELELNGSGDIEAAGRADRLEVELNGSGDMRLGALQGKSTQAELNGSGDITLSSVGPLKVELNGSGDIDVGEVEAIDAEINGSGDISYRGTPKWIRSEVNGSGDIRRAK